MKKLREQKKMQKRQWEMQKQQRKAVFSIGSSRRRFYQESVMGIVIQATGTVQFEDDL